MTVSNIEYQELEESNDTTQTLGKRMDLIKNVKVTLSVYIGDCELNVSELFDLSNGSVISLDRDLGAPVDVKYDGNVIARGELVAVDDNFGVRITDIEDIKK
ncbi:MAG: flagellar motor switch protein FliN [Gammaproteobacteria bacterium]|nr:flagellar motor switch protein FliN [Gammaproteobacteria bacterium]